MGVMKDFCEIQDKARERVSEEIEKFCETVRDGTSDPKRCMSISELEKLLGQHKSRTSQIYSDTLSEILESINQRELIESKKESTD